MKKKQWIFLCFNPDLFDANRSSSNENIAFYYVSYVLCVLFKCIDLWMYVINRWIRPHNNNMSVHLERLHNCAYLLFMCCAQQNNIRVRKNLTNFLQSFKHKYFCFWSCNVYKTSYIFFIIFLCVKISYFPSHLCLCVCRIYSNFFFKKKTS